MLIINVIVLAGGAVLALVASLVGDSHFETAEKIIAACAYTAVVGFYFIVFWATAGQTPGMRAMALRVTDATGRHPNWVRSFVRLIGLGLAIIPLGAGFLPVLVDDKRRALQDFLAGTVVIYVEDVVAAVHRG